MTKEYTSLAECLEDQDTFNSKRTRSETYQNWKPLRKSLMPRTPDLSWTMMIKTWPMYEVKPGPIPTKTIRLPLTGLARQTLIRRFFRGDSIRAHALIDGELARLFQ